MKCLSEAHQKVLVLCGSFGYLANRDLAHLVWPNMTPNVAMVTAQRATKKLCKDGFLFAYESELDQLTQLYVLTRNGAEYLNLKFEDDWSVYTPGGMLWFRNGHNVSKTLTQIPRQPLITLLHEIVRQTGWHAIGQRALARGFLGLGAYAHFEAVLLNDAGEFLFGCYVAHSATGPSTEYVKKLACEHTPFLIAAQRPTQLQALVASRGKFNELMESFIRDRLPAGLVA